MNTAGLLLFVLIGLFVVWLCHKADGDYIEANPDDMTKNLQDYLGVNDDLIGVESEAD